jgi:co-chaperonin GroES (HSP10)
MIFPIRTKVQTAQGIVITSIDKTAPREGLVLSVGPGKNVDDVITPPPFAFGDHVIYAIGDLNEIKQDGDIIHVIPATEILCKVTK